MVLKDLDRYKILTIYNFFQAYFGGVILFGWLYIRIMLSVMLSTKNNSDFEGTMFSTVLETQYVECDRGKGLTKHVT